MVGTATSPGNRYHQRSLMQLSPERWGEEANGCYSAPEKEKENKWLLIVQSQLYPLVRGFGWIIYILIIRHIMCNVRNIWSYIHDKIWCINESMLCEWGTPAKIISICNKHYCLLLPWAPLVTGSQNVRERGVRFGIPALEGEVCSQ